MLRCLSVLVMLGITITVALLHRYYILVLLRSSFVQNDVSQDKELNRRIALAAMNFGKLKNMVFYFQEGFIESKI